MKQSITRFKCDAPKCKDVVDVETQDSAVPTIVGHEVSPLLPDGWIEFALAGGTVDGAVVMVHASKPECAAELAEDQVAKAVEASEQRVAEEEVNREKAEEARKQALAEVRQQEADRVVAVEEAAKRHEEEAAAAEVAEER